jgi:hypothetical protein
METRLHPVLVRRLPLRSPLASWAMERRAMRGFSRIQISRRARVALEYSMAILGALASSYLILHMGL